MIQAHRLLMKQEWRLNKWGWSSLLMLSLSAGFLLTFYWLTQKALHFENSKLENGLSYFQFVFLGEVFLMFPFSIVLGSSRVLRQMKDQGVFDLIFSSYRVFIPALFCQTLVWALLESVKVLLLILLVSLFGVPWAVIGQTLALLSLSIFLIPASFGFGLISCALVLKLGRGDNLLPPIVLFTGLVSGAYFPTTVFPPAVREITQAFFPFALFLEGIRSFITGGNSPTFSQVLYFSLSSVIWLLVGMGWVRWNSSKA